MAHTSLLFPPVLFFRGATSDFRVPAQTKKSKTFGMFLEAKTVSERWNSFGGVTPSVDTPLQSAPLVDTWNFGAHFRVGFVSSSNQFASLKRMQPNCLNKPLFSYSWGEVFVRFLQQLSSDNLFYNEFLELQQMYLDAQIPVRMFGTWAAVAINCGLDQNTDIRLHKDAHNFKDGLCFTIPFGSFANGGDLYFFQLKTILKYRSGDVAAFQSLQQHQVLPFHDQRFSLVLFSHNNLFYKCKSK